MTRKLMRLQWGANITDSGLWIRVLAASSELPRRHMLLVSVHSDFFKVGRATCKHITEFRMETRTQCAENNLLKISHIWTTFSKEITHLA